MRFREGSCLAKVVWEVGELELLSFEAETLLCLPVSPFPFFTLFLFLPLLSLSLCLSHL